MNTLEIINKIKEIGISEFGENYDFCSFDVDLIMFPSGIIQQVYSMHIFLKDRLNIGSSRAKSLELAFLQMETEIKLKKGILENTPIEITEEKEVENDI